MTRSSPDNLIHLDAAIERRSARPMTERERSRQWLDRLRREIRVGNIDAAAAGAHVKPASMLTVARLLSSGRYPSFWRGGVYARQGQIGADPDVGLSAKQIARIINLLVATGFLECEHRDGRTCLVRPKTAATPDTMSAVTPDTMSAVSDAMSATPDTMSDDSSYLRPLSSSPLNPPAEPPTRCDAAGGQASKGNEETEQGARLSDIELSPSFTTFWEKSAKPRGPMGFALAEWNKLSIDQQRFACERPARGAWAGIWLRNHGFDLEPTACTELAPYSAEWHAERGRRIAAGLGVRFMDAQASEGKSWTVKGSP